MTPEHQQLLTEFNKFAQTAPTAESVMQHIAERLHEKLTRYNWVGFYLVSNADPNILLVGPFVGSFTPNARIPLDTGLCGAAATSGQTVVVHDDGLSTGSGGATEARIEGNAGVGREAADEWAHEQDVGVGVADEIEADPV